LAKTGNIAVKHCFYSLFPSISSLARHFPKQNLSLGSSIVFSLDLKAFHPCFQEAKFAPPTLVSRSVKLGNIHFHCNKVYNLTDLV